MPRHEGYWYPGLGAHPTRARSEWQVTASPNSAWVMFGDQCVPGDQSGSSVGFGMGNDQPVKWVFRPRLPKGYFRDDRERVIAYNALKFCTEFVDDLLWSKDDPAQLIQISKLHYHHRRNAHLRFFDVGQRFVG